MSFICFKKQIKFKNILEVVAKKVMLRMPQRVMLGTHASPQAGPSQFRN